MLTDKWRSVGITDQPSIGCNPHLPPCFNIKRRRMLRFGYVF